MLIRIGLFFSLLLPNNNLFGQDLLYYRNGHIINGENHVLVPIKIKNLLGDNTSVEIRTLFKKYRRIYSLKKIILATESLFILNSVGYRTGVPKLNATNLCIGLSAATCDILLRNPLHKRAKKFVEEYNYDLLEIKYKK